MQCQDDYSKEPYGKITSSRKDNTSVISKTDFLLCLRVAQNMIIIRYGSAFVFCRMGALAFL